MTDEEYADLNRREHEEYMSRAGRYGYDPASDRAYEGEDKYCNEKGESK